MNQLEGGSQPLVLIISWLGDEKTRVRKLKFNGFKESGDLNFHRRIGKRKRATNLDEGGYDNGWFSFDDVHGLDELANPWGSLSARALV
jgi:hypothetical protein